MSRLFFAAAALGLSTWPAAAGGFGCATGQCYQQTYVPPSYETVTERVLTRAPRTYAITTPAEYRTVHDTVQVSPGGRHWSVTRDAYGRTVGCWVSTPPRYASVARTVMVRGPEVVPYAVPAQYGYRNYSVQTSPGYRTWSPIGSGPVGGASVGGFGFRGGYEEAPRYGHGSRYGRSPGYGHGSRHGLRAEPAGYERRADRSYGPSRAGYGNPGAGYGAGISGAGEGLEGGEE